MGKALLKSSKSIRVTAGCRHSIDQGIKEILERQIGGASAFPIEHAKTSPVVYEDVPHGQVIMGRSQRHWTGRGGTHAAQPIDVGAAAMQEGPEQGGWSDHVPL